MEMMVVISIITLLLSMTMPSLQHARHHGRIAMCASNLRQIMSSITNYGDDTRFYPAGLDNHADNSQRIWLWPTQCRTYTGNDQDVFHCPQAPGNTRWVKEAAPGEPAFFGYKENEKRIRGYTHKFSYGYNVWGAFMGQMPNTGMGGYRGVTNYDATPQYYVKKPVEMIAFTDSNVNDFWSGFTGPYRTGQWPSRIHFNSANVAYVDMHVTLTPRQELVDVMSNDALNRRWNNDNRFHPGTIQNDGVPDFP